MNVKSLWNLCESSVEALSTGDGAAGWTMVQQWCRWMQNVYGSLQQKLSTTLHNAASLTAMKSTNYFFGSFSKREILRNQLFHCDYFHVVTGAWPLCLFTHSARKIYLSSLKLVSCAVKIPEWWNEFESESSGINLENCRWPKRDLSHVASWRDAERGCRSEYWMRCSCSWAEPGGQWPGPLSSPQLTSL